MAGEPSEVARALAAGRLEIASRAVALQYLRRPGRWEDYDERGGRAKSIRDAGYHLDFLAEALALGEPSLFRHHAAWVKALFVGLGFREDAAVGAFECMGEALRETLSPGDYALVRPYVEDGIASAAEAPTEPPSFLTDGAPHGCLTRSYLQALLAGDRERATRLVLGALEDGTPVREIYLHVFQPVQREIGRLRQANRISVAKEHYCTAATQLLLARLFPHLMGGSHDKGCAVVACASGELHEMGARMVADFLEMDGWDTYYVGANAPVGSVVDAVQERGASLLAVSTTMVPHLRHARELVKAAKACRAGLAVIVGGYPFNVAPGLWQAVGADGWAEDAKGAVDVARAHLRRS